VAEFVHRDVLTTAGHAAVGLAKGNAAPDCFWFGFLHMRDRLADFAMKSPALEEGIEFHFLKTSRSEKALFVACGHVARSGLTLCFGFRAF